jgi:transcriptional regulator with XRE-family HTH domain
MQMAKIRKQRGMSQAVLADLIEVEQPTISRLEREDEGSTLRLYKKVAKALGVSLAELFAEDREMTELILIEAYRKLPQDRQAGWIDMAKAVSGDLQVQTQ